MSLVNFGGLHFVEPLAGNRYVSEVDVGAAAIGDYDGGWDLAYALDSDPNLWHPLASGSSLPPDSLLHTISIPSLNGHITLRLTDDYQIERFVRIVLVTDRTMKIDSPAEDSEYDYNIPIIGSVFGPDFDSAALFYSRPGGIHNVLHETTGEYFDSLIFNWNASGVDLGNNTLYLYGYFGAETVVDSVSFVIRSAFAEGWPQELSGRGALSAACADLNHDGLKEVIVGTTYGLHVFQADGQPLDGFPALLEKDARCIPAVYDVDRDGDEEIICTTEDGLHVFNYDGTYADGWPVSCTTGGLGYGLPVPTVTELSVTEDSAIVLINRDGQVLAYEFNGDSYFYSLEGWFASFASRPTTSSFFDGNAVTSADLVGDGFNEVVASFSANATPAGVGIFEARTGQPAFDRPQPQVLKAGKIYGTALADLDGDKLPEIITCGYDSTYTRTIWVKTKGEDDLPGWPVQLPDIPLWQGIYPMVTDLDLDNSPELLFTFFEFDVGALYIFKADGTPYKTVEGRPFGEAYFLPATFGVPIAANLTGDARPEIVIRSGYILPGTGREQVHILDHTLTPIPGWPVSTPASPSQVFSTPYTPTVDDIDGDNLVELILVSEGGTVYVWDFDASIEEGDNRGRLFMDDRNSSKYAARRIVTDVAEPPAALPLQFSLHQNYPNPFNPMTTISFDIAARSSVSLDVFNVLGQRVARLIDGELSAGKYAVEFDGRDYASGVYFYRLLAGESVITRKMVLVK
jgi:hypothetical protein